MLLFKRQYRQNSRVQAQMKHVAIILTVAAVLLSRVYCGEPVATYLDKYGNDLAEAWTKYPSEKQAAVRQLYFQDLDKRWTGELKTAQIDADTMTHVVQHYVNRMMKAGKTFRPEKMK